ncbi:hydrogenase formation protein HypD [Candidatus Bathyarchaeota archaeon]|nr:hydrogenase formation protein HypD [Candidatus Bathyarchaeota archaeon]
MSAMNDPVLKDGTVARKLIGRIKTYLNDVSRQVRIMHVCGTHEHAIAGSGLRTLLPPNLEVISGPGCPVCVCHTTDITRAIHLAEQGITVATFGDMLRVPTPRGSLRDARSRGHDIRTVYSITDAIDLANGDPGKEVVFFAVGFETFAPVVASAIEAIPPSNFSFLCSLKRITPVMELLLSLGNIQLDGFITPGHVSVIIGTKPYDLFVSGYRMPIVTAGFQPNDVLLALSMLARQIRDNEPANENEYKGIVRREGNTTALDAIDDAFEIGTVYWRGIGAVPDGGFLVHERYRECDAVHRYKLEQVAGSKEEKAKGIPPGCSCHLVITGQMKPEGCPMFKNEKCHPRNPVGPCMVSEEGTCRIAHEFREATGGS